MIQKSLLPVFAAIFIISAVAVMSCKKSESATGPNVPTYPVTATVVGPSGSPQGGATLSLQNQPFQSSIFSTVTDNAGHGTIQSPSGQQTLVARLGTVFQATISVNVAASSGGTNAGVMTLQQNANLGRVLVVYAGCEQLENVLRSDSILFNTFDTTYVDTMRARAQADSTALLSFLTTYALVFSDCNCGDETSYPLLARIYGRYVQQGGKIYGGHYNYMNLQYIFAPNYQTSSFETNDSINIIDQNLSAAIGYTVAAWPTGNLGYQKFTDLPAGNSTVYAVITGTSGSATSPQGVPLIVENRVGSGKYLWTIYHNQDILYDPNGKLVKIVRYFLYSL